MNKKYVITFITVILILSSILIACSSNNPKLLGTYTSIKIDIGISSFDVWTVTFGDDNTVSWKNPLGIGNWTGTYQFIKNHNQIEVTYTKDGVEKTELWDIVVIDSEVIEIHIQDLAIKGAEVVLTKEK